jgi:hypothetical protein
VLHSGPGCLASFKRIDPRPLPVLSFWEDQRASRAIDALNALSAYRGRPDRLSTTPGGN